MRGKEEDGEVWLVVLELGFGSHQMYMSTSRTGWEGRSKSLYECLERLTGGNANMLGDGICLSSMSTRDDA